MGSFLSCLKKRSGEREPLLPKSTPPSPPLSSFEKVADIIAALQSGKLPSQDQLDDILRQFLRSTFLNDDQRFISGRLSQNGNRILMDTRDLIGALLQFGMEKNMDDRFQDLLYQISVLKGTPVHVNADVAIQAERENLARLQDEGEYLAPSQSEFLHDTSSLLDSLITIARLLITSEAFRILFSDIISTARSLLAQVAADIGHVAERVQLAAGKVENAACLENRTPGIPMKTVEEAVEDIKEGIEETRHHPKTEETAKDIFVMRVQELIFRAHADPHYLAALQTCLNIIRKYSKRFSHSATILSETQEVYSGISPTPKSETLRVLDDVKVLLERLASGQSLDPLLHAFKRSIQCITENIGTSTASVHADPDLQEFFSSVNSWLSIALDPDHPSYVTSRHSTHALEDIYDVGYLLFFSSPSSGTSPATTWTEPVRSLLDAYDSYTAALANDRTTNRLLRSISTLRKDLSDLAAQCFGMGTRIKGRKDEFIRDLLGWVLPRILNVVGRIGVPMPRVEYKSGNIKGALDALKMGPGQPGGVVLDLVPDHVVVRTWNEVRIDMRVQEEQSEQEDLPSTSSNSRVRIHIDGVRLAVKDLGYFVSYGGRILQYSDQGLLDLGIGAPNVATQGLTLDIDLALDTIPSEPAPNSEAIQTSFDVLDVHVAIPGVRFKLNKSKHWILNKLFVQPLARPAISRVTASILEEKIHSGLEGLSKGLETFLSSARAKSRDRSRGKTPVKPGFMDYWDALLEIGSTAFGLSASEEEDDAEATGNPSDTFETYSKTTATMKGIIHTTISNAAGSSTQEGSSTEETAIAVGGGPILFSDKAGAYDSEDDGPSVEESLMQEVDSMVEQVEGIVGGAAESAAEVREGVIRAEDRRRRTITIERRKKGWKSQVFDFGSYLTTDATVCLGK